jgi:hypothetical protein
MPAAIYSFKIDSDGEIRVLHVFFGKTDADAEANLKAHADVCPKFGPAYKKKETVEIPVELDSLPEGDDEDAIGEWLDEVMGLEPDEEDDDVSGDEEDEEEEEEE